MGEMQLWGMQAWQEERAGSAACTYVYYTAGVCQESFTLLHQLMEESLC